MSENLPGGVPTAYLDTFASDRLPPADTLPFFNFSGTPELAAHSDYMNVATELLDCPVYTVNPQCHSDTSRYAVQKECDGKSKCSFVVDEAIFGKPPKGCDFAGNGTGPQPELVASVRCVRDGMMDGPGGSSEGGEEERESRE